jgi:hypothetical protein
LKSERVVLHFCPRRPITPDPSTAFLQKPFELGVPSAKVRELLDGPSASEPLLAA